MTQANTSLPPLKKPTVLDTLIRFRESLFNALLGVDSSQTLNDELLSGNRELSLTLASELRQATNALRAAAINEAGSKVDYKALRDSPAYTEYRQLCTPILRQFDPTRLKRRHDQLAFWVNLYNALVIDAVIHFSVESSVNEGPVGLLTFFRRAAYNIDGLRLSLEDVEHGILRGNAGHPYLPGPQFGPDDLRAAWVTAPMDVRIHFALNCASRSCPPIGVYDGKYIDHQLDLAARSFVDQDISVDTVRDEVRLSQIFKWYERDFGGKEGVEKFLIHHLPVDDKRLAWLNTRRESVRLVYKPYDWSLNI